MGKRIPFPSDRVCGERYRGFLTLAGGIEKNNPCSGIFGASVYCNEGDCEAWKSQSEFLWAIVRSKYSELYRIGYQPSISALKSNVRAYREMHMSSPECTAWMTFGLEGASEAIQSIINEIEFGICVLDQIEHELTVNIPDPQDPFVLPEPPLPPAPHDLAGDIATTAVSVAVIAAIAAGVYAYTRLR